ncbi:MAG: hypothetical protein KDA89_11595, partial [Planctomycetaceae bacterium]|nr:hypothetical protein [Planctomycetaceae bacterium]
MTEPQQERPQQQGQQGQLRANAAASTASATSAAPTASAGVTEERVTSMQWVFAVLTAGLLAAVVWKDLLTGGGIVGGDTYPYFFPQKVVVQDAWSHGEIPLWHDRTGLGYPLHAESQAGVFYPPNLILCRLTDVNAAYNAGILLHYILACVFTWRFARCQGLRQGSALLAAMVFVYGWFPARLSLEWSIIGGVWFPCCLWLTDRLIRQPSALRFVLLSAALGLHLLAGHFTLAFITELTCLAYAVASGLRASGGEQRDVSQHFGTLRSKIPQLLPTLLTGTALVTALLLAAVQLVPTLELRQLSQRDGAHEVFNPAYGHMPPVYLTQLIAGWWYWHSPEIVMSREMLRHPWLASSADTNQVEAHLYVGLIPLLLLTGLLSSRVRSLLKGRPWKMWMVLSALAVLYGFGWFVPITRHLPGFGFFMGPARYTIITAMGFSVVSGLVLDALQRRQ